MKKIIAVLLAFAMVFALAACGGEKAPAEEVSSDKPADDAAPAERIRIELWHRASADMGLNVLEDYAKSFNESQDKYEVVCVYNSGEYQGLIQELVAEAATGNTPGICQIGYSWRDFFCLNFPVNDLNSMEGGAEFLEAYDANLVDLCTAESGEVVGIPVANSCPIFYYNTEICQEAGLDLNALPETWDEVIEWAKTITEKTDKEGFSIAAPPDFWLEEWMIESNGGSFYEKDADGKYTATFNSDVVVNAMQQVADLYAEGTGVYLAGADAIKSAFSSGKLGIMIGTIGWSAGLTSSCNFDFVTHSVVSCAGNDVTAPTGGSFFAITATDDEIRQGAWEFLQYLGGPDGIEAWSMATGYLPGRADVRESESFKAYVAEHPYLNAGLNVVEKLNPPVSFPGSSALQLQTDFCNTRDAIYCGQDTAENLLNTLAESANSLMND